MGKKLLIKKGREKSLLRQHPWVFSGALASVEGEVKPGETCGLFGYAGQFLGRAAYSPASQIVARVWSFDPKEEIDEDFFRRRLVRALKHRERLWNGTLPVCFRLVNAENDGLPGVVIDRYGEYFSCQFLSYGAEAFKGLIVKILGELMPAKGIIERSDVKVRSKEGLEPVKGILAGTPPDGPVVLEIEGLRMAVDLLEGHKTGAYLDQRENWPLVASEAKGKSVLNCFAYTGGFGLWALKAGASEVIQIESSLPAAALIQANLISNQLNAAQHEVKTTDVFTELRKFRDQGRQFDLIILDPPKFAESVSMVPKAARGYKDINLLALKLLNPGGMLFTFSCSGAVDPPLFQSILAGAAVDSGRSAHLIKRLGPAKDQAPNLAFPEGDYLKGLQIQVAD